MSGILLLLLRTLMAMALYAFLRLGLYLVWRDLCRQSELMAARQYPPLSLRLASEKHFSKTSNPEEKIALFRSLFRGRVDIYPRLWISKKTGKKGFSPICNNEWVDGVCEKPKIKCNEYLHRSFAPVTGSVISDHLEGKHTMGVYPLLTDETCWFLAIGFDKEFWANDVNAFMETCKSLKIPAALERSRSGKGAHVWIFFSAPILASNARKLGSYLLTETMSRYHQMGMDS